MDQDIKVLSFAAAVARVQAAKNNSDMANLATALENVRLAMNDLGALKARIEDAAKRIEGGAVLDVGEVNKLYNEAQGFKGRTR